MAKKITNNPKYTHGKVIYFIDERSLRIIQGKVENIITKRVPIKDEQSGKVIGTNLVHTYEVITSKGGFGVDETELFETFVKAASTYALAYFDRLK